MNLWILKPGHKVGLRGGGNAEVLAETQDGERIMVRYLEVPDHPALEGSENLTSADEIEVLLGVAPKTEWGEEIVVIVHHIPESEEAEEGYEALTMKGVPHNVSISAESSTSAQEALDQLLSGLKVFGFSGRVNVEDATYIGGMQQYKVEVH
jgi:hypothetical protein